MFYLWNIKINTIETKLRLKDSLQVSVSQIMELCVLLILLEYTKQKDWSIDNYLRENKGIKRFMDS